MVHNMYMCTCTCAMYIHVQCIYMTLYMCNVYTCTCTCAMYIHVHVQCIYMYMYMCNVYTCTCTCAMYVSVAVPRQDSMSPARANAVLSGYCNRLLDIPRFVGYP